MGLIQVLTVYLIGAIATAIVAMGSANRLSGARTDTPTLVAVAALAGALWPVVVIGALQVLAIVLLAHWMGTTPAVEADTDARHRNWYWPANGTQRRKVGSTAEKWQARQPW